MAGKAGGKIEIYEYTMSMQVGVCAAGDGLELVALKYGDKEIWRGSKTDEATIAINQPTLFGGDKKEGGVKGLAWWYPGKPTQTTNNSLAKKLGLTSATCPGFRGWASVWFTGTRDIEAVSASPLGQLIASLKGSPSNNQSGFYWGANNPYLRSMSARVRRPSIGLNPAIALIRMPDDSNGNQQYASNPIHMIYECYTNTDWGMGENPDLMDKVTYEAVAQVIYDEGFGLNMIWTKQSEIGKFIGEVCNHIQAAVYVDPSIGKHTIKLLRADYDVETLPEINPGNAVLSSFKRKVWGEISNEIVVTMTDPETGKEKTTTAQDLAGIAAEGGIVSSSRNYPGITSTELGNRVAERDLAASVNPIATCEATVSREFWKTITNGVVKLNWPEYQIDRIVFRVSIVGKTANTVTLSLYEDIFGLDSANYLTDAGSGWVNPSQPPTPATAYQIGTAPAFFAAAALGLNDPSELDYPEVIAALTVGPDSDDDVDFDVVSNVADVNGTVTRKSLGTRSYRGSWTLTATLPAAAASVLASLPGLRGPEPVAGDFILFGTGTDDFTEIATVQSVDGDGYHINRGMLDTVPRDWPSGARAFVVPISAVAVDPTVRSIGEDTSYWLQTRTTVGRLEIAETPQINITMTDRPYRSNRPANVKVNGVGFGTVNAVGASQLTLTWANRNRTHESTQALKWTDADVAGESGQTTRIIVYDTSGNVIRSYDGLTGTSKVIPVSDLTGYSTVRLKTIAVRDSVTSLQGHMLTVSLT